ncbi:Hpt domain-containing protein [Candidatus Kryptobacter tengchongensis]|uniref:Hpt domain-containing protein n=1 Tax=Kryptobacter tengchongensis TaxID=1643429 RepID=A0A656D3K2_KRYT1|nr:Hpt domain-containing protein [Candidatus Kryptobacter tengchongensis]CUS98457.1 Hpt domain-containing protein [Candidatus Kryptobacter tengchongensis]
MSATSDDFNLKNLQKIFLSIAEKKAKQMMEAIELKNFDLVKLYAHQLKGSGGSYGFSRITEISSQIEQKCIQNSCDEVIKLVQELHNLIDKLKQEICSE